MTHTHAAFGRSTPLRDSAIPTHILFSAGNRPRTRGDRRADEFGQVQGSDKRLFRMDQIRPIPPPGCDLCRSLSARVRDTCMISKRRPKGRLRSFHVGRMFQITPRRCRMAIADSTWERANQIAVLNGRCVSAAASVRLHERRPKYCQRGPRMQLVTDPK
jgi:hypothetical protein